MSNAIDTDDIAGYGDQRLIEIYLRRRRELTAASMDVGNIEAEFEERFGNLPVYHDGQVLTHNPDRNPLSRIEIEPVAAVTRNNSRKAASPNDTE